jgi:hypothetical protein
MVETGGGGGIPTILIFAPMIVIAVGIVVLLVVTRDEGRKKGPADRFMTRANHPLRHVEVALNAERKVAREKAQEAARQQEAEAKGETSEPAPPKPRKQRPDWIRRVS